MTGMALALGAALGLAACGPDGRTGMMGDVAGAVLPAAVAGVLPGGGAAPATATPSGAFTPERIAADPAGYMLFSIPNTGATGLARRTGSNGAQTTWLTQTGFSMTFQDGLLVATRGLGQDLMAADTGQVLAAIRAGGGQVQRVHELLDSQDRILRQNLDCTITDAGVETVDLGMRQVEARKVEEDCRSAAVVFQNLYWLDGTGEILHSRQLVSPTVAYLRSGRL